MIEKHTARDPLNVQDVQIELMGFCKFERDLWERDRNDKMLELIEKGFSMGCIAKGSGYAQSRVEAYVRAARERRQRA